MYLRFLRVSGAARCANRTSVWFITRATWQIRQETRGRAAFQSDYASLALPRSPGTRSLPSPKPAYSASVSQLCLHRFCDAGHCVATWRGLPLPGQCRPTAIDVDHVNATVALHQLAAATWACPAPVHEAAVAATFGLLHVFVTTRMHSQTPLTNESTHQSEVPIW